MTISPFSIEGEYLAIDAAGRDGGSGRRGLGEQARGYGTGIEVEARLDSDNRAADDDAKDDQKKTSDAKDTISHDEARQISDDDDLPA